MNRADEDNGLIVLLRRQTRKPETNQWSCSFVRCGLVGNSNSDVVVRLGPRHGSVPFAMITPAVRE